MKKIRNALSAVALSAALFCFAGQADAATAASSMHYGKSVTQLKASDAPIVITNCTEQQELVGAWFTDGSSKSMPIYPQSNYPDNVISIDESSPYVDIEVTALDGTILFPYQAVYPGQQVNIGCDDVNTGKYPTVIAASH